MSINEMVQGYLETAIWSSTDDQGRDLDRFSVDDIWFSAREEARQDCEAFVAQAEDLLDEEDASDSRVGHDFWLTRNGHGAGFWDGDYRAGDALTEIAESFGMKYVYITNLGTLDIA